MDHFIHLQASPMCIRPTKENLEPQLERPHFSNTASSSSTLGQCDTRVHTHPWLKIVTKHNEHAGLYFQTANLPPKPSSFSGAPFSREPASVQRRRLMRSSPAQPAFWVILWFPGTDSSAKDLFTQHENNQRQLPRKGYIWISKNQQHAKFELLQHDHFCYLNIKR